MINLSEFVINQYSFILESNGKIGSLSSLLFIELNHLIILLCLGSSPSSHLLSPFPSLFHQPIPSSTAHAPNLHPELASMVPMSLINCLPSKREAAISCPLTTTIPLSSFARNITTIVAMPKTSLISSLLLMEFSSTSPLHNSTISSPPILLLSTKFSPIS